MEAGWVEAGWVEAGWVEAGWVEAGWVEAGWVDTGRPIPVQEQCQGHEACVGRIVEEGSERSLKGDFRTYRELPGSVPFGFLNEMAFESSVWEVVVVVVALENSVWEVVALVGVLR